MKVSISVLYDNWNTYPRDDLEFEVTNDLVTIRLSDNDQDREISIPLDEFKKLARFVLLED